MKVIELRNLARKDVPIYYKRFYSGVAVVDLTTTTAEAPLEFQIEHKPTGETVATITSMGAVDYPLVPLKKEVINFITALDSSGKLPN